MSLTTPPAAPAPLPPFRVSRVLVDVGAAELRQVDAPTRAGIRLTAAQVRILALLGRERGVYFSQRQISEEIDRTFATVKMHVWGIRRKLRLLDPDAAAWLETAPDVGYRLRRDPDQPRSGVPPVPETPDVGAVLLGMLAPPPAAMGGAVLTVGHVARTLTELEQEADGATGG